MGAVADKTRVALNTSTGTQDITASLGGLNAKAALFTLTRATTDGSATDGMSFSRGAADGTNQWYNTIASDNGLSSTAVYSGEGTDHVIYLIDGSGTVLVSATFSSWITNGVRINIDSTNGTAYLLTVELYAGTDVSAAAGVLDMGNTVDTAATVSSLSFRPEVLHTASNVGAIGAHHELSIGLAHENGSGTVTQRSVYWGEQNARPSARLNAVIRNDSCVVEALVFNSTDLDWWGEAGSFTSSGFSVTPRNDGANNHVLHYLALAFGGAVGSAVVTYSTPTSTGSDSFTGLSFKPQYVSVIGTMLESSHLNTFGDNGNLAGARMVGSWTAASQYANSFNAEDGPSTSNTQSLTDNVPVELPDDNGGAGLTATFTSFNSDGWTLNYSAVEANAKIFFVLAIEEEASGANTGSLTKTLADATLSAAGKLAIEATATITLAVATLAATAGLAIDSTLTATLEDAALSATGALALTASLGATLEDAALSASGGVAIAASLTATLEDAELSATAVLALAGAVIATLDDAELAATGVLTLQAALTATLENAALSADAALAITAALTATLEDAELSATGTSGGLLASLTATLADASLSSAATLALSGALTQTLEAAGLSADVALAIEAALTATLEDASLSATGIGPGTNTAALTATLEDAALSASGALALSSALSQTLEDANLAGTGELAIAGALTATLSDATLSAVGSSMLIAAVTILRSRQRTNLLSAEARSNTLSARARSNVLITPDRGT